MTGIVVLTVLTLALVAMLERGHRRHGSQLTSGPRGSWAADDRDVARSKLDLLALGGSAEPFTHKPAAHAATHVTISRARLFAQAHGRHAA